MLNKHNILNDEHRYMDEHRCMLKFRELLFDDDSPYSASTKNRSRAFMYKILITKHMHTHLLIFSLNWRTVAAGRSGME